MNASYFLAHLSLMTVVIIALPFAGAWLAGMALDRIDDWYFIGRSRTGKGPRLVRRWYGTSSRVIASPGGRIWEVEKWERYADGHVWLLLIDPGSDDGPGFHWVSAADVQCYEVPRFRPHLDRGVPHLHRYVPAGGL